MMYYYNISLRSPSKTYYIENFRPNIVVKGCRYGFREDAWQEIAFLPPQINTGQSSDRQVVKMDLVKPSARCTVPTVDFTTGVMNPNNPVTRLLKTFRTGELTGFKQDKWAKQVVIVALYLALCFILYLQSYT